MTTMTKMMLAAASILTLTTAAQAQQAGWCSDQNLIVFSGGPAGGTFNSIIDKGATQAAMDTGANVQIIYSD